MYFRQARQALDGDPTDHPARAGLKKQEGRGLASATATNRTTDRGVFIANTGHRGAGNRIAGGRHEVCVED